MQQPLLILLLVALQAPLARSGCAVVQDDLNDCPSAPAPGLPYGWPTDPAGTRCVPRPAGWSGDGVNRSAELVAHTFVPFNDTYGNPVPNVCPQFPEVCCTNYQMNSLHVNFKGVWAAFGDIAGGGCPGCYQNAVNFWCGYTCSPRQDAYVTFVGLQENTVDPVGGGVYTVGVSELTLDTQYACSVYDTCLSTGKVKEFSPLQSCEGFFKYQGQTEAIFTGLSYIQFNYSSSSSSGSNSSSSNSSSSGGSASPSASPSPAAALGTGALSWPLYSCCNFPAAITPDAPLPWPPSAGGVNMSCPCASCKGMCSGGQCLGGGGGAYAGLGASPDNPLLGYNAGIISIFASCVMAVSVPLVLWRALGEGGEEGGDAAALEGASKQEYAST